MSKFLSISVAFATVAGFGISGYMMGQSDASDSTNVIKVIITNAISDLPENKQGPATDLLGPILELAAAQQNGTLDKDNNVTQYENKLKANLKKITLMSYQAGKSPFIPPKKMTQFLCSDQFRFSYKGLYRKSKEDEIYLGNEFGDAPIMGRASKAGTIAHEISHYKSVGGTDGHEYVEEECVELAKDDPDKALDNADNFQYFIEGDSNE